MNEIKTEGNYEQWVYFFLVAIEVSTLDALKTFEQISAIHDKNLKMIEAMDGNPSMSCL